MSLIWHREVEGPYGCFHDCFMARALSGVLRASVYMTCDCMASELSGQDGYRSVILS